MPLLTPGNIDLQIFSARGIDRDERT